MPFKSQAQRRALCEGPGVGEESSSRRHRRGRSSRSTCATNRRASGSARTRSAPIDPNHLPPGWTPATPNGDYPPQPSEADMDAARAKLATETAGYATLKTEEIHTRLDPLNKKQAWWKKRGIPTADDYVRMQALTDEVVRRRQAQAKPTRVASRPCRCRCRRPRRVIATTPGTRVTWSNGREWADAAWTLIRRANHPARSPTEHRVPRRGAGRSA